MNKETNVIKEGRVVAYRLGINWTRASQVGLPVVYQRVGSGPDLGRGLFGWVQVCKIAPVQDSGATNHTSVQPEPH